MDEGISSTPDSGESLEDEKSERRAGDPAPERVNKKKSGLGWIEWLRGWWYVIHEFLFQRIMASHLQNPLPLPPVNELTCIVTGSTSGIGLQIARYSPLPLPRPSNAPLPPVYVGDRMITPTCLPLGSWSGEKKTAVT